jgi:glycine cleavage system transcriptional repressor
VTGVGAGVDEPDVVRVEEQHAASADLVAVTVIGHDRPGIIADVTEALSGLGGNLEDTSMTILRGHFAMTLLVATDAQAAAVDEALAPLSADGSLLVSVRGVPPEDAAAPLGTSYVLSVHGADRTGIVAGLTRVLAEAGGNITDLTTRLAGDLYVLVAEVDLPPAVDVAVLADRLGETAQALGVEVALRPAEPDVL